MSTARTETGTWAGVLDDVEAINALLTTTHFCSGCETELSIVMFHRDSSKRSGLMSRCKSCRSPYDSRHREYEPEGRKARAWRWKLSKFFGLTPEDYQAIRTAQDDKCLICGQNESYREPSGLLHRLAVDHDHTTGKVRGLLCRCCNVGLGYYQDSPERLRRAAEYLESFA